MGILGGLTRASPHLRHDMKSATDHPVTRLCTSSAQTVKTRKLRFSKPAPFTHYPGEVDRRKSLQVGGGALTPSFAPEGGHIRGGPVSNDDDDMSRVSIYEYARGVCFPVTPSASLIFVDALRLGGLYGCVALLGFQRVVHVPTFRL